MSTAPFIARIKNGRVEVIDAVHKHMLHTHNTHGYVVESVYPSGDDEIVINFTNGKSLRTKAKTGQQMAWY